jgi:3-oxosteroid 1-dehydrogenase
VTEPEPEQGSATAAAAAFLASVLAERHPSLVLADLDLCTAESTQRQSDRGCPGSPDVLAGRTVAEATLCARRFLGAGGATDSVAGADRLDRAEDHDRRASLAVRLGGSHLAATVERFNGFARTGVDGDYHRGKSAYDRYYGDPTNKPNPNLGEISHAPYYAANTVPGDLGTKGGIRTDVHARALRDDGSVIEGLYAAGNVSAPVMGHSYPGAGGTIGPAMAFGYLAALHIAGKN